MPIATVPAVPLRAARHVPIAPARVCPHAATWAPTPSCAGRQLPDLNDPQVRALPLATLALAIALMERGGRR